MVKALMVSGITCQLIDLYFDHMHRHWTVMSIEPVRLMPELGRQRIDGAGNSAALNRHR